MRAVVTKEQLMESELYREIFSDGRAEGWAAGEARGEAKSILSVLAARGIPVSDAVRERILACRDIPTLDVWVRRAAVAATAAAVVRAKATVTTGAPERAVARKPAQRTRKP
jgi:hypothetical protein